MPEAVRGEGQDLTISPHGLIPTDTCSADVFVNGFGMVRLTDKTVPHVDWPELVTGSATVFANGLGVGRKGDIYVAMVEHLIITGSGNVWIEELGGGGPTPSSDNNFLFDDGQEALFDSGESWEFE